MTLMLVLWIIFIVLAVPLTYLLFVQRPQWGLALLLLELILGGNGRWLELMNGAITLRYVLIFATLVGYGIRLTIVKPTIPRLRLALPLVPFLVVLCYGVYEATVLGNPQFLQDAQVWLYLLVYPMVVDLWNRGKISTTLPAVLLWSIAGIAAIQIALTVAFNSAPQVMLAHYSTLERMRILISPLQGTSFYSTFMGNSSLYGYSIAVPLMLLGFMQGNDRFLSARSLWVIAVVSTIAAITSMTRGTWGQIAVISLLVAIDYFMHRKLSSKLLLAALLTCIIVATPMLALSPVRDALATRLATLSPANRNPLDSGDSFVYKANEAEQQWNAITQRPLFGYGFGEGRYEVYGEYLAGKISFHNSYLQFALKTGIVGLAVLLVLFAYTIWVSLRVSTRLKKLSPECSAALRGMVYGFAGALLATMSNPHMTTPVFVAAFALLLASTEIAYRGWRQQTMKAKTA